MKDLVELGQFLKAQRERRGLTREAVATQTRLSVGVVSALEDGVDRGSGELVFVQNHLRSYAQAVGLSPDAVVADYLSLPGVLPPTEQSPQLKERARRTHAYRGLVVAIALALAAASALWWWTAASIHP